MNVSRLRVAADSIIITLSLSLLGLFLVLPAFRDDLFANCLSVGIGSAVALSLSHALTGSEVWPIVVLELTSSLLVLFTLGLVLALAMGQLAVPVAFRARMVAGGVLMSILFCWFAVLARRQRLQRTLAE